jgi:hypothetical protein
MVNKMYVVRYGYPILAILLVETTTVLATLAEVIESELDHECACKRIPCGKDDEETWIGGVLAFDGV